MTIQRNIKTFSWFNFFYNFSPYGPIMIFYFAKISGSFALAMGIFSIVSISGAIFELPTGVFSDKIGRKNTMIAGAFAFLLAIICYAIGASYWWLVIGAIFEGLSLALYSGAEEAFLFETLKELQKENSFHHVLGKISSACQISLAVSAIICALIVGWSIDWVIYISIIPQILSVIACFFFIEPKVVQKNQGNIYSHIFVSLKQFIKNKKLKWLTIANVISGSFGEAVHKFDAAFIKMVAPLWVAGVMRTLNHGFAAISFWFAGRIINKFGHFKVLFGGTLVGTIIYMTALLTKTILSPFLIASTALIYGATSTAKSNLFQKEFTNEQRATMGSVVSFLERIIFSIAAVLIGYLADVTSPMIAMAAAISTKFIVMGIYWKILRKE